MAVPEDWVSNLGGLTDERLGSLDRPALGPANPRDVGRRAGDCVRVARTVAEGIEMLPAEHVRSIGESLGRLSGLVSEAEVWDGTSDAAITEAKAYVRRADEEWDFFRRSIVPYLGVTAGDPAADIAAIRAARERAEGDANAATTILNELRPRASDHAADVLSARYGDQVGAYRFLSKLYLGCAAMAAGAAVWIGLGLWPFDGLPSANSVDLNAPNAWLALLITLAPRLFLVLLALYALRFCIRNYGVNRHLEVLNEHRRNALDTFLLFKEGQTTVEARNGIVLELVRAVFRDPPTGYISEKSSTKLGLPMGYSISVDTQD